MLWFLLGFVVVSPISYVVFCWAYGVAPWPIRWFDRG